MRNAFVVKDQTTGFSKGVGYVTFAVTEDAQMAFEQIETEGVNLDSRQLRVQWADNKPTRKERSMKDKDKDLDPEAPVPAKTPRPRVPVKTPRVNTPKDPLAIRTVIIGGLPAELDDKVLWKKVRKFAGAEHVEWPVNDDSSQGNILRSYHLLVCTHMRRS